MRPGRRRLSLTCVFLILFAADIVLRKVLWCDGTGAGFWILLGAKPMPDVLQVGGAMFGPLPSHPVTCGVEYPLSIALWIAPALFIRVLSALFMDILSPYIVVFLGLVLAMLASYVYALLVLGLPMTWRRLKAAWIGVFK